MRGTLLASVGMLALTLSTQAPAETKIDKKDAAAQTTSKAGNGKGDSILITSKGSVTPKSGNGVTIDSNHNVTNEGTIQIVDADGANGIYANAGIVGSITNKGKIVIDEKYKPTDTDKDGIPDGPFAKGGRRAGILTAGAMTGTIANTGEITVQGNDSAGIWVGGPLTGNFSHTGTTDVKGDRAVGVRLDKVNGNVELGGTIGATGRDAVGARIDGDVSGSLLVNGTIASTGYRYTKPPANAAKLKPEDLLQGGSALVVGGDVAGGIVLADTKGKVADVVTYGSAPAFQIGAANRDVAIGAGGKADVPGLQILGKVTGNGVYTGVAATGLQVGGKGGAVTIANGITVNGAVAATAVGANATAMTIGAKATVPALTIGGEVAASGGAAGTQTTAILIDGGASVGKITNTGTIKATAGGAAGSATAILDKSGTVRLIENSGTIAAGGADAARAVAIDLSANTTGTTVRQVARSGSKGGAITGAIRFGSGDDLLDLADGSIAGDASFGAGNNRFAISGSGSYQGTATFGAGNDTLTIADKGKFGGTADFGGGRDQLAITGTGVFAGRLLNAGALAVTVAPGGGTFAVTAPSSIGSLGLGDKSILGVTLNKANAATPILQVGGATTIGAGSKLALQVEGANDVAGRYVVLRSGTLTGGNNLTMDNALVPFLYKGAIVANNPNANEIAVDVARKAKTELGLNKAQASAFDAIDAAIGNDAKMAAAIRGQYDGKAFRASLDQMLPNYSGGVFEMATLGARAIAAHAMQPAASATSDGQWGLWLTPVGYGSKKRNGATAGYDVSGWGIGGGLERRTDAGAFGASLAYLHGKDKEGAVGNRIDANQYELAAYWRGQWGGLATNARASVGWLSLDSVRNFRGKVGNEKVERKATGNWNATLYSVSGSASYEHAMGAFSLRPALALDYHKLKVSSFDACQATSSRSRTTSATTCRGRNSTSMSGRTASVASNDPADRAARRGGHVTNAATAVSTGSRSDLRRHRLPCPCLRGSSRASAVPNVSRRYPGTSQLASSTAASAVRPRWR